MALKELEKENIAVQGKSRAGRKPYSMRHFQGLVDKFIFKWMRRGLSLDQIARAIGVPVIDLEKSEQFPDYHTTVIRRVVHINHQEEVGTPLTLMAMNEYEKMKLYTELRIMFEEEI